MIRNNFQRRNSLLGAGRIGKGERCALTGPLANNRGTGGFSLLELVAVIVIVGIVASIVLPRMGTHGEKAKSTTCDVQRGNIEVQVQLFYRNKGRFPVANLSDIGSDTTYFPEGLPVCPVHGASYQIDTATGRITGHSH